MPAVVPDIIRVTPKHWSFMAAYVWAADPQVWVLGTALPGVSAYGTSIVIDGLSFLHMNLSVADETVGGQVYSCTRGANAVVHQLDSIRITAGQSGTKAYWNLNIPSEITQDRIMTIWVDAVAGLDNVLFTCWGHYETTPSSEPTPVSVQEFHFSPPKKKVGPV